MVLVQVQKFGTATRYEVEILYHCGKNVKTKSLKLLGANSQVCRSYRGKISRGGGGGEGGFLHRPTNNTKSQVCY